ncbi:MAG TPA: hypothetical protein DCX06_09540 [Opitutae bacterium]|nr:hypothetical protein [Opitutae bacterium]
MKRQLITLLAVCFLNHLMSGQALREIIFTTYGQYPVRGVEYSPVSQEAIAAGAKIEPPIIIKTHALERSGPYTFKGTSPIRFVSKKDQKIVAQVSIPKGSEEWLLIFIKNPRYKENPDKQLKFLVYPFDDSSLSLPKNNLVFLNFSGKDLAGLLEQERVSITRGESAPRSVQESLPMNLWARSFDGEKLLPALIKTYTFQPNHRYLMIFFPPVLRGSVDLDVRLLSESVE